MVGQKAGQGLELGEVQAAQQHREEGGMWEAIWPERWAASWELGALGAWGPGRHRKSVSKSKMLKEASVVSGHWE
jgi:hypothetical protein